MIGVIFVGWGTRDLVDQSLAPWVELRRQGKATICAVSLRFAGFEGDDDGTTELLQGHLERGDIDNLITGPQNIPETTARGMALTYLKQRGVDMIIQWDSDEVTDIGSIERALLFVDANPFAAWFRISYRNLVFDEHMWLAEPFTPPRIHRVKVESFTLHSFTGDNDLCYGHDVHDGLWPQSAAASMTIPPSVCNPKHYSWLSDTPERAARSRSKIAYQMRRWGAQVCSFAWDDAQGGLIFNPALPRPKVIHES